MATQTSTQRQTDASVPTPVPIEALAGGTPHTATILALDLGHRLGWALRSADGVITSGVAEFRQDRWQGGGIKFLRFKPGSPRSRTAPAALDLVRLRSRFAGMPASTPRTRSVDGSPSSPPGASITALPTRACRSAPSSAT